MGPRGYRIAVDGALVPPILRKPFGYREAKDSKDDLDREIALKLASGYPDDNIIYEDTRQAVLRQNGREAMRAPIDEAAKLLALLDRLFAHEPPELGAFRAASAKFRADLPQVLDAAARDRRGGGARRCARSTGLPPPIPRQREPPPDRRSPEREACRRREGRGACRPRAVHVRAR